MAKSTATAMRISKMMFIVPLLGGAVWLVVQEWPARDEQTAAVAVSASLGNGENRRGTASAAGRVTEMPVTRGVPLARAPETTPGMKSLAAIRGVLERAIRDLDGAERTKAIDEIGRQIARENIAWAVSVAAGLDDFQSRYLLLRAAGETLVGADPAAAAAWAAELAEPALRDGICSVVAMKWAETEVAAAVAWALALTEGSARASAVEGVTWSWAQKDPKAVYEWAVGLAEPEMRGQVLVKLSKLLAVQNPQQALSWAVQFPEGPARDQALHYAIFQWAAKDLQAAAEWSTKLKEQGLRAEGDVAIARSWSNQEAQGATIWAAGIADPASRTLALATTLRKWAETSPAAAGAWLVGLARAPANEEIFRSVTSALANSHPEATSVWLRSMADPSWRAEGERILAEREHSVARKSGAPGS